MASYPQTLYGDNRSPKAIALLTAIAKVCKEHNLSIGHEDHHGSFLVNKYDDGDTEWLLNASEEIEADAPKIATSDVAPDIVPLTVDEI